MLEESADSAGANEVSTGPRMPRSYSADAKAERQVRVTDLIPARPWSVTVLILAVCCAFSAILFLQTQVVLLGRGDWLPSKLAYHWSGHGTLMSWFTASLFTGMAGYALLTFLLRRHKTDDYRGRYRLWLWVTGLFIVLSVDTATSVVHQLLLVPTIMAASRFAWDPSLIWSIFVVVVLMAFVARMTIEMWNCRTAVCLLILAFCILITGQVVTQRSLLISQGELGQFYVASLTLAGHCLMFLSVLLNARHVYLDAQELLPVREPKSKAPRPKQKKKRPMASRKSDLDPVTPVDDSSSKSERGDPARGKHNAPVSIPMSANDDSSDDGGNGANLSKAERRRLRKMKRRQSKAA